MITDFIKAAAAKLEIDESAAKSATGGVFDMVKDKLPAADFGELTAKIPGIGKLLSQEAGAESGGGLMGGLGGIGKMAGSMLGGGAGGAAGLLGKLAESGLGADKAGSFVKMLTGYIKEKAGEGMLQKILGSVPALKGLIG